MSVTNSSKPSAPENGVRAAVGVTRSAATFFSMTFISRIFGYLRDVTIMVVFGAGVATDAFLVAFRLPNFLRRLFAEGAFTQAFVPVLAEYKDKYPQDLREMIDRTAGTLAFGLVIITALGILLAPILIILFAPGFYADESKMALATTMLQITFPYILFISLTALVAGILNTYGHFAVPALTPVLLNLALIGAALWLAPQMDKPIIALAWGVLIAGVAQLAMQWFALRRLGIVLRPKWGLRHSGVRRVMRLMSPAIVGASVVQVNLLVDVLIASFLVSGSISWLYISDRFVELPVGLFGVALATVLLPKLSQHYARGDRSQFHATLNYGFGLEWLIALPCVAGLILLAEPILIALVQYREFSAEDTQMASFSLIAYATGLPAFMLSKLLNAGFFSRQNTKLPVKIAVIAMLANIVFNLLFVAAWDYFEWHGAHAGLALATSLSSWLNCALLYRALSQQGYQPAWQIGLLLKVVIACVVMGITIFWLTPATDVWQAMSAGERLLTLGGLVILGAGVYVLMLAAQGLRWRHMTANG